MLEKDFFTRSAEVVARDLIGCWLIFESGERLQITETEAYLGPEDTASHARFGKTDRTKVMWAEAGTLYVYLSYGIHHLLNIVTGKEGDPQAVLIRGAGEYDGPGKLTKRLGITKDDLNRQMLGKESGVWVENRQDDFDSDRIEKTSRIGIDSATREYRDKRLRFIDTNYY